MAKTCCAEKENKIRSDVNYTKVWMEKLFLFPLYGPLGKDPATKSDEFLEKCQRGGGHFQSKIYVPDFGNFKQGFLSMKLIKRRVISGFRAFFNNCIDIN